MELLLKCGADESERCYRFNTPSEVVGVDVYVDVIPTPRLVADADLVCELLAKVPTERVWRRRRQFFLCLARNRARKRRSIGREGKRKERGAEEGTHAWGGGGCGDAAPSRPDVKALAAVARRGKRERTSSKVGGGCDGGDVSGCSGAESGGDLENVVDFDGVEVMLLDFEGEGFFRAIVGLLLGVGENTSRLAASIQKILGTGILNGCCTTTSSVT